MEPPCCGCNVFGQPDAFSRCWPQDLGPAFFDAACGLCMSQNRKRDYLDKDYKLACRKMWEIRAAEKLESLSVAGS